MSEILSVSELKRTYEVKRSAFSYAKEIVKAVDGVSFQVDKGKTLGIVGESGSGKSTLARCVMFLERPDSGKIVFQGNILNEINGQDLRKLRREMQIIFQDPYSSLNPRMKIYETLAEPVLFHNIVQKEHVMEKVEEILEIVGLSTDYLYKYPHEMSGGQRQRVAIGRALTTNPSLIVADEPVSSLDVSIQAQIINLFMDIKEKAGITMLFISHDLNVVRFLSDEIIVMYKGRVVEAGKGDEVFYNPLHPYTKMLIDSVKGKFAKRAGDDGHVTGGCPYYPRCERRQQSCLVAEPELTGSTTSTNNHAAACFLVE
ncbi:MAG: ATP-binding cassette domain-containing protein [Proteobacteria bacterium]|nr:ATP-binding cassette domain-containing protein [Pseudomonadota bacterium]